MLKKLLITSLQKWRYYSFRFAFYDILWWFCFCVRTPLSYRVSRFALKGKSLYLDNYIKVRYADILNKYSSEEQVGVSLANPTIWVFWGQGEDNMPPLVKACYKQLCYHNDNVELVTNANIDTFIDISPIIKRKAEQGCIGWANYSDIIRHKLLSKYGGLWVDATVWVARRLPIREDLQSMPFYSANSKIAVQNRGIYFWTSDKWNWSSWCLWSNRTNSLLHLFVGDMLHAIALNETIWPDYVVQDYLIHYACLNFESVRDEVESMTMTNPNRGHLATIMDAPYEQRRYLDLIKEESFFKLSYRSKWKQQSSDGRQSFYGRILDGVIDV